MTGSFSSKRFELAAVAGARIVITAAGIGALSIAIYRAPDWVESWYTSVALGAIGAAVALMMLAVIVAVSGTAATVGRVATELCLFACALVAAESILIARDPAAWSDNPDVQRLLVQEDAARKHGVEYDGRLVADVVRELQASGVDAVPGFRPHPGNERGGCWCDFRPTTASVGERQQHGSRRMQRRHGVSPFSL